MIIAKQPMVKLLRLAEQVYLKNPNPVRGRPYTYSEQVMFKCLIVKTVKRQTDVSALYRYLNHEGNVHIREAVGLREQMPHPRTFRRRFEQSAELMQRQIGAIARQLAQEGVISFEMLSVDGTMCEACGADWHQSDKKYAHLPAKLRNVDYTAEWGKSDYRGWVYGYEAMLCATPNGKTV